MPCEPPKHVAVLVEEVLTLLRPEPGMVVVDGTLGGGGHTRRLAEAVTPGGRVIAIDRDPAATAAAADRLAGLPVEIVTANYANLPEVARTLKLPPVDGVLLDLGLSSDQLADERRGFSFDSPGPVDLRFDATRGEPAWKLLQRLSADDLANILYGYGEERYSRRIARTIVQQRRSAPPRTSQELAAIVRRCVPRSKHGRIDTATRTFQALRIAVNDELKSLEVGLQRIPDVLVSGGRMVIISFHSLEDRRVKHAFRDDPRLEVLTRRVIRTSAAEAARNPRARSARLRAAQRVMCG